MCECRSPASGERAGVDLRLSRLASRPLILTFSARARRRDSRGAASTKMAERSSVSAPHNLSWMGHKGVVMVARPRRSVLYMPGSNAKALAKARSLDADAIIIDLEDSVAPDAKPAARALVVESVRA